MTDPVIQLAQVPPLVRADHVHLCRVFVALVHSLICFRFVVFDHSAASGLGSWLTSRQAPWCVDISSRRNVVVLLVITRFFVQAGSVIVSSFLRGTRQPFLRIPRAVHGLISLRL